MSILGEEGVAGVEIVVLQFELYEFSFVGVRTNPFYEWSFALPPVFHVERCGQ